MEDINLTTFFYRTRFRHKLKKFNRPSQLPDYFGPMIGDKKEVRIADLGAGPINTIGESWPGVKVTIVASDIFQPEYATFWEQHKATPIVPIEYQDFEHLTYPDNSFDIVHCVNALDHTKDAKQALSEFKRVCKPDGWIYLRHGPDQKNRFGGMHQWNASMDGFRNGTEHLTFDGFTTTLEDDHIVSLWQKP